MINSKPNVNLEQERFYFENSRKGRFTNIRFELDKVFDIGHYVPKTNSIDDREEANEMSYSWFAWVERAEIAQENYQRVYNEKNHAELIADSAIEEINSLKLQLAKLKQSNIALQKNSQKLSTALSDSDSYNLISKQKINALEKRLLSYEELDCIPFPREPNKVMLEILESHMFVYPEMAFYESNQAYEELIKLVEKENGKTENN